MLFIQQKLIENKPCFFFHPKKETKTNAPPKMNETELTNTVVIIKKCSNHIRGCRNILAEDYSKKMCEGCLRKIRETDKQKRDEAKAKQQATTINSETNRVCTTCCKEYPIEQFKGIRQNTTTKTCQTCRENNKKQDAKRDKEHRNELARECSKKPEQIARKKEWVENNYDKVAETWQRFRQNQIETDLDGYLKKNAEHAKKWRETNPEKCVENVEMIRNSSKHQYTTYIRSSAVRNIPFELTFEEFENIIKNPCYYCGEFTENCSINGLDRTNFEYRYTTKTCVSCCKFCNMMKNTLNEYTFIKRIEHILTFQQLVQGQLHQKVFCDYAGCSFSDYKTRAKKSDFDFDITIEYFRQILFDDDCYLCGKANSTTHRNGIDRYDNNIGYTVENCRVCCANCNYLKRHYSFDELIRKMVRIYNLHKNKTFEDTEIVRGLAWSDKLTKAELENYHSNRKEQRIEQLKNRYTPEQIKQNAQVIAEKRTKNNTQTNPVV